MKKWLVIIGIATVFLYGLTVISYNLAVKSESKPEPKSQLATVDLKAITSNDLLSEINKVRVQYSLSEFKENQLLAKSARLKCEDMATNHYYEHANPTTGKKGGTYITDVGMTYISTWSENLNKAGNTYAITTAKDVVDSWMDSQAHRESILNPKYTEIGFATCSDNTKPDELIIVQHKIEV